MKCHYFCHSASTSIEILSDAQTKPRSAAPPIMSSASIKKIAEEHKIK